MLNNKIYDHRKENNI